MEEVLALVGSVGGAVSSSGTSGSLALLIGAGFRLGIRALIDFFENKQEFEQEQARVKLQDELEANRHGREIAMIKAQKEAGVEVIPVSSEMYGNIAENTNFTVAVSSVSKDTGYWQINALNSLIRPGLALFCIVVWGLSLWHRNYVLTTWDLDLIGVTLGVFIGSRISATGR